MTIKVTLRSGATFNTSPVAKAMPILAKKTPDKTTPLALKPGGIMSILPDTKSNLTNLEHLGFSTEKIGQNLTGFAEGLLRGTSSVGNNLLHEATSLGGLAPNPVSKALKKAAEDVLKTSYEEKWSADTDRRYNPSDWDKSVGNFVGSVARMAPSIMASSIAVPTRLASALGGAGTLGKAALVNPAVAKAAGTIGSEVGLGLMGASAAGSQMGQQYRQTGDLDKSQLYGAMSGTLEILTEKITGGIPLLNKGWTDDFVETAIAKIVKNPKLAKGLVSVTEMLGEGGEEAIATIVDPFLQRITVNPNAPMATAKEILDSAIMGVISSAFLKGSFRAANLPDDISRIKNTKNYNSDMRTYVNSYNAIAADLPAEFRPEPMKYSDDITPAQVEEYIAQISTARAEAIAADASNLDDVRKASPIAEGEIADNPVRKSAQAEWDGAMAAMEAHYGKDYVGEANIDQVKADLGIDLSAILEKMDHAATLDQMTPHERLDYLAANGQAETYYDPDIVERYSIHKKAAEADATIETPEGVVSKADFIEKMRIENPEMTDSDLESFFSFAQKDADLQAAKNPEIEDIAETATTRFAQFGVKAVVNYDLPKNVHGFYDPATKTMHINGRTVKSEGVANWVMAHEITHYAVEKDPAFLREIKSVMEAMGYNVTGKGEASRAAYEKQLGHAVTTDYLNEEAVANFMSEILNDNTVLSLAVKNHRGFVERLSDFIDGMMNYNAADRKAIRLRRKAINRLQKALGGVQNTAKDNSPRLKDPKFSVDAKNLVDYESVRYSISPPYKEGSPLDLDFVASLTDSAKAFHTMFQGVFEASNVGGSSIASRFLSVDDLNLLTGQKINRSAVDKMLNFIPDEVKAEMHIAPDGQITALPLESKFRMNRSFMQRLVDAMPMENASTMMTIDGKEIKVSPSDMMQVVGGEEYRRALTEEVRRAYRAGQIKPINIKGLSKDKWGTMGFLATNGKTGASGDFTTICPQMFFNEGCYYCYRAAALRTGLNNKLVGEKVWYSGEILRIKPEDIADLNEKGGLRIQSFGDWMPHFTSMLADVLYDAEMVGLQIKIITKEPSMIEAVAYLKEQGLGENLYFNLSTDYNIEKAGKEFTEQESPLNEDRPFMRDAEGQMWWKRALAVEEAAVYRDKYKWVNTRIVATTIEEFIRGLKSNIVDVVTGYHGGIRLQERIDSETGKTITEVEPLGDAGMPRFIMKDGKYIPDPEYPGKTKLHKQLAQAIIDKNLVAEYYMKTCCITGRCASCKGICGVEAKKNSFEIKNETNRDTASVAYWRANMKQTKRGRILPPQIADLSQLKEGVDTVASSDSNVKMSLQAEMNRDAAITEFGTTLSLKEAGYLTTNGKLLDFSGKRDGGPSGSRSMDHREIKDIYPDLSHGYSDAMYQFMEEGNIRLQSYGFELTQIPTKEQEAVLIRHIQNNSGEVSVDLSEIGKRNTNPVSTEYPEGTKPSRIFSDIKQYYETGKEPVVSDTQRFRMSLQNVDGLYSKLEMEIADKVSDNWIPGRVMSIIRKAGVREDEIKWSGIEVYLADKKTVNKADLLQFLKENAVEIEEVQKGAGAVAKYTPEQSARLDEISKEQQAIWDEIGEAYKKFTGKEFPLLTVLQLYNPARQVRMDWANLDEQDWIREKTAAIEQLDREQEDITTTPTANTETKWEKYTLPGGENYKEFLLTLPGIKSGKKVYVVTRNGQPFLGGMPRTKADADNMAEVYRRDDPEHGEFKVEEFDADEPAFTHYHWQGIANVLTHARTQDFATIDGEQALVLLEMQSDWHQTGAKEGYRQKNGPDAELIAKRDEAKVRLLGLGVESSAAGQKYQALLDEFSQFYDSVKDKVAQGENLAELGGSEYAEKLRSALSAKEAAIEAFRLGDIEYKAAKQAAEKSKSPQAVADAPFKDSYSELAMKKLLYHAASNDYDLISWVSPELVPKVEKWPHTLEEIRADAGLTKDFGAVINVYEKTIPKIMAKYVKQWGASIETVTLTELANVESDLPHENYTQAGDMWDPYDRPYTRIVQPMFNGEDFAVEQVDSYNDFVEGYDFYPGELHTVEDAVKAQAKGKHVYGVYNSSPTYLDTETLLQFKDTELYDYYIVNDVKPDLTQGQVQAVRITPEMKASILKGQPKFSLQTEPYNPNKPPQIGDEFVKTNDYGEAYTMKLVAFDGESMKLEDLKHGGIVSYHRKPEWDREDKISFAVTDARKGNDILIPDPDLVVYPKYKYADFEKRITLDQAVKMVSEGKKVGVIGYNGYTYTTTAPFSKYFEPEEVQWQIDEIRDEEGLEFFTSTDYEKSQEMTSNKRMYPAPEGSTEAKMSVQVKTLAQLKAEFDAARQTYGTIKPGADPRVQARSGAQGVPTRLNGQTKISEFMRSNWENPNTPVTFLDASMIGMLGGSGSYFVMPDAVAKRYADHRIKLLGVDGAFKEWKNKVGAGKALDKNDLVLGEQLAIDLADNGKVSDWEEMIAELSVEATRAGQNLQAFSLLKKLSPTGRAYKVRLFVKKLQEEIDQRNAKKGATVVLEIPKELLDKMQKATTPEEMDAIEEEMIVAVAAQIPATLGDKVVAWRYLSMLGNLRTHNRNIISNTVMMLTRQLKDTIASGIESGVDAAMGGTMERSKFFAAELRAPQDYKDFAKQDFAVMKDIILTGSKFDSLDMLYKYKRNFGKSWIGGIMAKIEGATGTTIESSNPIVSKAIGIAKDGLLENAAKGNSAALELEDTLGVHAGYRSALLQYMMSNKLSPAYLSSGTRDANGHLAKARQYAVQEAQKAVYREANSLADWLSKAERSSLVTKVIIGGLMPFKRTPLNILKRGVQYSPFGLVYGAGQALFQVRTGKVTAAQAIDSIACGLTGSMMVAVGAFLASLGMLKAGGGDDEKKEAFDEMLGEQPYSVTIFGKNYTVDWLTPSSMPLMAGVEYVRSVVESDEKFNFNQLLDALLKTTDPVTELSMLQSVNNAISTYSDNKLMAAGRSVVESYIGQFIPTVVGQATRIGDPVRRDAYAPKGETLADTGYFINKMQNKAGMSTGNEPALDLWGREQTSDPNAIVRAVDTGVMPYYAKAINKTPVDQEILKVFAVNKNSAVIPGAPANKQTYLGVDYTLSEKDRTEFRKTQGQTAYKLLGDVFKSNQYAGMTQVDKEKVIADVYTYAAKYAKDQYAEKKGIEHDEESLLGKVEDAKKVKLDIGLYFVAQQEISGFSSDKKKNGDSVTRDIGKLQTKKSKTVDYLKELDLTKPQRDAILLANYPKD